MNSSGKLSRGDRATIPEGEGEDRKRIRAFVETIIARLTMSREGVIGNRPYDIDQSLSLDEPVYHLTLIIIACPTLFNCREQQPPITIIPDLYPLQMNNRHKSAEFRVPPLFTPNLSKRVK